MVTGPSCAQRGGGEFKAVGDLNSSAIRGERQRRRRRRPARAATDGSRDVPLVEKELEPELELELELELEQAYHNPAVRLSLRETVRGD